ncbi:MAG: Fe-S cluster assembly protein SufD [Bacteroidetes bacterium]|nr:Fe-S cluster assembly protein SufD [Bacteroidota bacterium]
MSLVEKIKEYSKKASISSDKQEKLSSFLNEGFPTIKDEEWKYTSLKNIVSEDYSISAIGKNISSEQINKHSLGFNDKIVFVDGILVAKPTIKNVLIADYSEFKTNEIDSISKLNYSLAKSGYTISISDNSIIESPIEILFFNTVEGNFTQYRNLLSIGKNSEVKFIEKIQNIDCNSSFINHFTQIDCGKNTKVEYNKIQNNSSKSRLIDTMDIYQNQDSVCNINTLIFGGEFVRNNLNFEQNGTNAESNMNGVSVLNNSQLADNHTFIDHKSAHCRSNEMYKGVYLDESKGVFNGKIMVRQDSQKIDAFQANNTLLLSENATINSKPQLEIYADDVKCSHGCTIGQLDKEALFYMRSRGIGIKEAQAVLTYAFASQAINNITIDEVVLLAKKLLAKKLNVDLDFAL